MEVMWAGLHLIQQYHIMINSITNTTNQTMKDLASFDPYFIYAIMKTFDNNPYCDGLSISSFKKYFKIWW